MNVKLSQMRGAELAEAFRIYAASLKAVVANAIGWDEDFQQERFFSKYEPSSFSWIDFNSERIGYVSFFENSSELHISLLIILDKFQKQKFGRSVMENIQERAFKDSRKVTLSSFKINEVAVRFYMSLGYKITSEDDHFYDMELSINK